MLFFITSNRLQQVLAAAVFASGEDDGFAVGFEDVGVVGIVDDHEHIGEGSLELRVDATEVAVEFFYSSFASEYVKNI